MYFFAHSASLQLITFILLALRTHLDGRKGRDDGGRAEAVRDEAEVGEVPLYRGVEYLRGPRVAQRRAVLVQQVHQLFRNYSAKRRKTLMNHESRTGRTDGPTRSFFLPTSTMRLRGAKLGPLIPSLLALQTGLCFGPTCPRHFTDRSSRLPKRTRLHTAYSRNLAGN